MTSLLNAEAAERLLGMLDEQSVIYARLADLAVAETTAIRGRSIDVLGAIVKEQAALASKASGNEAKRSEQLTLLGAQPGASMEELADLLDEPAATRLRATRANLLKSIEIIQLNNRENEGVLQALAKHYGESAQALIRLRATYSRIGEVRSIPVERGRFEMKA